MKSKIIKKNENYTYKRLKKDIDFLLYEFQGINHFEVRTIGKSFLGNDIPYLKIGEGNKKIMINASHHANEWITSLIGMSFFEKLLNYRREKETYKSYDVEELLRKSTLFLVPMVNPDGVDFVLDEKYLFSFEEYIGLLLKNQRRRNRWKANIRGVDLNLNYPANWDKAQKIKRKKGIFSPNYRDYVGPNPLSEVETQHMVSFTKQFQFDLTISLHSQGEEIYWDDQKGKIKEAYEIGKLFEKISGYQLTKPQVNSSYAGYKDWYIQEFSKPGYTIEVGKGEPEVSLPIYQVDEILDRIEEIFLISMDR